MDQLNQDDIAGILNQNDIDSLITEAKESGGGLVFTKEGKRLDSSEKMNIEDYDFRNPIFLTETELRQIRIRHERFVHYLAARLSMFLRMDCSLKMSKLYTTSYAKFTEAVPNPTFISLFEVKGLAGVGVVDINPRLAMTIINRMLGGKGHSIKDERYLTEIEISLMEDALYIVLQEWCRQWTEYKGLESNVIGHESSGRFLNTAPQDSVVLVLDIETTLGDCSEPIQLALPYMMIEPIIRKMQEESKKFSKIGQATKQAHWAKTYDNISIPVSAEWEPFEITVRDLLNLRPGDVLEMPENAINNTLIRLKNTLCFVGNAGIEADFNAVKITKKQIIKEE